MPIVATEAEDLITQIRARGGRVYRYMETRVLVLTTDVDLVKDLLDLGARYMTGLNEGCNRCFFTGDGQQEWDLEIQQISKPETAILDENEDVVGTVPALFPGLWEAAADPARSAFA